MRVSSVAVASVLVATTSTTEAFGLFPSGGRGISGTRGRTLHSQVEESVKLSVDTAATAAAAGNSEKDAFSQRLAQQHNESSTKARNRGLSSLLHFTPLGREAKQVEGQGDHETLSTANKSFFGVSAPLPTATSIKFKSEATTKKATQVRSGLFHFIQGNEELLKGIETRQQDGIHNSEEKTQQLHVAVEEETRLLETHTTTADAGDSTERFGSSFVRQAPLEGKRPQAATKSRSKRVITSLLTGAQPTLLPRSRTETTSNNDGDDDQPKAAVVEPTIKERVSSSTANRAGKSVKKDATDYLSLLEKRQDEMKSRGKFDANDEHHNTPQLTSILEHDPLPMTSDLIIDNNGRLSFAKPSALSDAQHLALMREAKAKQSLEDLFYGSSMEGMLDVKTPSPLLTVTLKDGAAEKLQPVWLEEMLESSTDDEDQPSRILASILNDGPSAPQLGKPSNDDLLLALRVALKESKSQRAMEEILGGKSLDEMLETNVKSPLTTSHEADTESTLQEMLESKDGDSDGEQRNLLLTSILASPLLPEKNQRVLDRSRLLSTLSLALEEAKSKRILKEILDGRSLEDMLEATTLSQAATSEGEDVLEGMHVLANTGLNVDVLEELLEAKPVFEMKTQDEDSPTKKLKHLSPAQVATLPIAERRERRETQHIHQEGKKRQAFSYWDTVSPAEISSELIGIFTPERDILQLVKENANDLETLQFAVSRLAWGVIKGGTAAFIGVGTAVTGAPQEESIKMAAESTQSFVSSGTAFAALLWKSSKMVLERVAENNEEWYANTSNEAYEQRRRTQVENHLKWIETDMN